MQEEIINRVAKSPLVVFDLEDYYPSGNRIGIDISVWLWEGFILKEKEFREVLQNYNWSLYQDAYTFLYCSTDAIVPGWAYSLIAMYLLPIAKKVVVGTSEDLDNALYQEILPTIDYSHYKDKPVIIKGCAKKPVPANAYILASSYLQPLAKSIMYGEACSAVPLYKAPKK